MRASQFCARRRRFLNIGQAWRVLVSTAFLIVPGGCVLAQAAKPLPSQRSSAYQKLPLQFEPNRGQAASGANFIAHGQGYNILLQPAAATLELHRAGVGASGEGLKSGPGGGGEVVRMELRGANARAAMTVDKKLPGYVNYIIGNDPKKWQTGVPTFAEARVAGVYPGVDVVYYGVQRKLEYDFVVAPGADAGAIHMGLGGAKAVLAADGGLVLQAGQRASREDIRFEKPVMYQESNGKRLPVEGGFVIAANGEVGFEVRSYDHSRELVIDPIISYGSYFGGTGEDEINGSAVNAAGQLYAVGQTYSMDLPATTGELAPYNIPATYNINTPGSNVGGYGYDGFVTKFNASGTAVLWTTYLGGSIETHPLAVAVGKADNAYIAGQTGSTGYSYYQSGVTYYIVDYPVTGNAAQYLGCPVGANAQGQIGYPPYTQEVSGNCTTAFVSELSSDGKTLLYSSYLGGSNGDSASAIAVDATGNIYVAGTTSSDLFESVAPTTTNLGNDPTWFVLSPATSVPGPSDFPTTPNAYESATAIQNSTAVEDGSGNYSGGQGTLFPIAFLTVFAPSGGITYSTTIGGPNTRTQGATSVAVGQNGVVWLGGYTTSFTFPTTAGTFSNVCASTAAINATQICNVNGWVAAFDLTKSGASSLLFATYMTGLSAGKDYQGNNIAPTTHVNGLATDATGNVIVTGDTNANDMLTSPGGFQPTCNPHGDGNGDSNVCSSGFLAKLASNGGTAWSTYIHGSTAATGGVSGTSVAVGPDSNVYVLALATDSTLPLVDPISTNPNRNNDALLLEFNPTATALLGGTYIGSNGGVSVNNNSLQIDSSLNAYISGSAGCGGYGCATIPSTSGAFQTSSAGGSSDGWVMKIVTQQQPSATALVVSPTGGTATPSQTVTLTATVTTPSTLVGTLLPTGTVTFLNGGTTIGTGTLSTKGVATYSGMLTTGSYAITASYGGDTGFNGSVSTSSALTVSSAVATTTALAVSPASAAYGTGSTLTATVMAGSNPATSGTVTFTAGSLTLGTGTVNAQGVAALTVKPVVGSYSVIASYAGTYNATSNPTGFGASASAGVALTVTKAATTTALATSNANAGTGASLTLTATVTSGATGSVTFYNGLTSLGTGAVGSGGTATLTTSFPTAGTYSLTATYGGDSNDATSTSTAVSEVVVVPSFSVAANPTSVTIMRGGTGVVNFTFTPVGGYSGAVSISCGTLPADVTCSFSPSSVTLAGVVATDTLTIGTGTVTNAMLSAPRHGDGDNRVYSAMALLLPGPVLGLLGLTRRRKMRKQLQRITLLAGLMLISLAAVTGCSSGSGPNYSQATPAGSYTVPITVMGATGGTQAVSLSVVVQ